MNTVLIVLIPIALLVGLAVGFYIRNLIMARKIRLARKDAAKILEEGAHETLAYMSFPETHWRRIRTNNPLGRINKEIRRRTKVVGNFPDGQSALMLVAARLRYIANSRWGTWKYLNMDLLKELDNKEGKE